MNRAVLGLLACCVAYGQTADPAVSFEVASVKPSPPPDATGARRIMGCNGGPGTSSPGQYTCVNATVANLVLQAFGLKPYQLTSGHPGDPGFDVAAKIPAGSTKEQVATMIQNLLIERFKLAYHYQKKEMQVYDLVVAKGGLKMKESAPEPPPPAAVDGGPAAPPPAPPKVTMGPDGVPVFAGAPRGMTAMMMMGNGLRRMMSSDATTERIASILSGQLGRPVTDATGLKGKYDFNLTFAADAPGGGASVSASSQDGPAPAAPETDAAPIFAAIQEQLGLKLEQKKGAIDVFVIDHVEKTPTEN